MGLVIDRESLIAALPLHKLWANGEPGGERLVCKWRAVLTGADLTGADLTGADLTGAVLTGADLTGADLTGADLTGAVLTGAVLTGAVLTDADLTDADLTDADLTGVPLVENLDQKILALVDSGDGTLNMGDWHGGNPEACGTTHCRAGWAIMLGGPEAIELEKRSGPGAAGALIYLKSTGRIPDFFCSTTAALADIRECAAKAAAAVTGGV